MAAGAHGIIVEVHYNPAEAQCDGPQALLPEMFRELMVQLRRCVPTESPRPRVEAQTAESRDRAPSRSRD